MISEWFTDDELKSQLAMFFTEDERDTIDFDTALGTIANIDEENCQVIVKNRVFQFNLMTCDVTEVSG